MSREDLLRALGVLRRAGHAPKIEGVSTSALDWRLASVEGDAAGATVTFESLIRREYLPIRLSREACEAIVLACWRAERGEAGAIAADQVVS